MLVRMVTGDSRQALPRRDDLVEHILRNRQKNRTGSTLHRRGQGALDERDHLGRLARLRRPLHQRRESGDDVHLLESVATPHVTSHLADDCDNGRRVGLGGMQPNRQIRRSGRASRETEGRPSGQLGNCLRHERRRSLVTRRDHANAVCGQAVDHAQDAFARNGEGDLDAGPSQGCRKG